MKKQMVLGFCLLASMAWAATDNMGIGGTKAILESPVSYSTELNQPYANDPSYFMAINVGNNVQFKVDWQDKDNSRTSGYPIFVSANLNRYDFNTWSWQIGGTGHSITGPDATWGKYNNYGTWDMNPLQPTPITKYQLIMEAKVKSSYKRGVSEFYSGQFVNTTGNSRPWAVCVAAPNWIVGRYERALMYKSQMEMFKKMKDTSSTVDFNAEMTKLLMSATGLFAPTTPQDYAKDAGMEVLQLANSVFGNVSSGVLMGTTGAIYMGYQYTTWAKTALNDANSVLQASVTDFHVNKACSLPYPSSVSASQLDTALEAVSNAMRADATEFMRICYTARTAPDTTWKGLLAAEKSAVNSALQAVSARRGVMTTWFDTSAGGYPLGSPTAARNAVTKYLDTVENALKADQAVLNAALP